MSYESIIASITNINSQVTGIRQALDYEPISPVCPCIYTLFDSDAPEQRSSAEKSTYSILMRLLLRYNDAETCEQDVAKFVDRIKEAYQKAVMLNGTLSNGNARITRIRGAYLNMNSIIYRLVEFTLQVNEIEVVTYET